MPLQEQISMEKDLQSNSKSFHLIVDFNHSSFLTLKKTKANYYVTYNVLSKKSVIYDVINKLLDTKEENGMPFSFLVGDFPIYKLIVELQTENPDKFQNIVQIIGALYQQMSWWCDL